VTRTIRGASVILYPESAVRDHSLDEATVARETARQWLRPDAPDSISAILAKLWTSSLGKKPPKPDDFASMRPYLLPSMAAPVRPMVPSSRTR
jgi:hypothetical protein